MGGKRDNGYSMTNPELDRRIAELVGKKRYPIRAMHAETMTPEQRHRYGLPLDWKPSTSTTKRGRP